MKQLKNFLSDIDVLCGKSLFYSQSRISQILWDELVALIRCRSRHFPVISGTLDLGDSFKEQVGKYIRLICLAPKRGNSPACYSVSITLDKIPDFARKIIQFHRGKIEGYLGRKFLYEYPQVWRNFHLPNELTTYDVYSNVWHQDSHDGSRVIKLFIQLNTVTESDGPLRFLNRLNTRIHWTELRHRWDFKKISSVPVFEGEQLFTGNAGSYLILDSSRIMHRAGNPKEFRDIFQITLFPEWRKSNDRYVFN